MNGIGVKCYTGLVPFYCQVMYLIITITQWYLIALWTNSDFAGNNHWTTMPISNFDVIYMPLVSIMLRADSRLNVGRKALGVSLLQQQHLLQKWHLFSSLHDTWPHAISGFIITTHHSRIHMQCWPVNYTNKLDQLSFFVIWKFYGWFNR